MGGNGRVAAVTLDPAGRFERTNSVLGQGAYKVVYRGFDHEDALEVAWNVLDVRRLQDYEAEKVLGEVALLERLHHKNILNLYGSWKDLDANGKVEQLYFITELMTSGTLKEFVEKARTMKLKVIRRWGYNILEGLAYLHGQDPPVMHRDLKADNIFINGNTGEVKIGDLGLSGARTQDKAKTIIGTPEFMAPELYDENYTEKVDIYAFGMCILELLTMEYPYMECDSSAQIFRKVYQHIPPDSLLNMRECNLKNLILECLQPESRRPTAQELLERPAFAAWETDDGTLSNVHLSLGTKIDESVERKLREVYVASSKATTKTPVEKAKEQQRGTAHARHEIITTVEAETREEQPPEEVELNIRVWHENKHKTVHFTMHCAKDTPEGLADEVAEHLQIGDKDKKDIYDQIVNQVRQTTRDQQLERMSKASSAVCRQDSATKIYQDEEDPNDSLRRQNSTPALKRMDSSAAARMTSSVHDPSKFTLSMALLDAASKGKQDKVRRKLSQGADPSYEDYDRRTPLHLAAAEGHIAIVQLLIEKGANVNARDRWNQSPAAEARKHDHKDVVELLLEHGAEEDDDSDDEVMILDLLEFAARGLTDLVAERLREGCDPGMSDYDKRTALHLAAAEGHVEIVRLLVDAGADANARDRFGHSARDDALTNGRAEVLKILKERS